MAFCYENRRTRIEINLLLIVPYICCTIYLLYHIFVVLYICCTIYLLYYIFVVPYICCIIYLLYYIFIVPYIYCIIYLLYHIFVVLYICCTIYIYHIIISVHTEEGIARFTEEIEGMDWSETLGYCRTLEVSKGYQSFINVYSEVYNRCFPIAPHRTKHYRFKKPWMTPGLLKSCYKKSNLYKKFLKDPSADNKSKFILYRNRFKRVKDETITRYYSEKFTQYSNNITKTWDLLKLLLSRERYQLPPRVFYDF